MVRRSRFAALGLALLGAASVAFGAQAADPSPPPLAVQTALAAYETETTVEDTTPGLVIARRSSRLGFETGGRVAEIKADVGDEVEAGAVLAVLDLRTIDAELAAAKANAAEAKASVSLARQTATRQRELTDKGHVSQQRLDEATANVGVAAARLAAAEAAVDVIEARRALASLTAPYAGVITERSLDEGEIAAPGAPVLDLVETGALEIRVGLSSARAAALEPGGIYAFEIDGRTVEARLRAATGVVDRRTQTVSAVFELPEGSDVSTGAVARLVMKSDVGERGFWAPMTALASGRRGLWSLYVAAPSEDDGLFVVEQRLVEIVYSDAERAFVRGAVEDGERFITAGHDRIVSGQRVRLAEDAGGALARRAADDADVGGKAFP